MTPDNPTAAATAALAALDRSDVEALAGLMHPDALDEFKRHMLAMATMQGSRFIMGNDVLPQIPSMLKPVFKVESIEDLTTLPSRAIFTLWLKTKFKNALPPPARDIIGSVADGNDTHVVFRETSKTRDTVPFLGEMVPDSTIRVLTTRRVDTGWGVMLNGGIFLNDAGTFSFGWADDEPPEE